MDRRTFIRNGSFSVMALSLSSLPGFAIAPFKNPTLNIEQNEHIRHGLLHPVSQDAFEKHSVLFLRNHFYQGIPEKGASEQLQVLSILSQPLTEVRSIQLCTSAKKIDLVDINQSRQLNRDYNTWQSIYQDAYQRIELFSGKSSGSVVKRNPEQNEQFFLALAGNVQSNFGPISPQKGQKHCEKVTELRMLQNNCSIVCVTQLSK